MYHYVAQVGTAELGFYFNELNDEYVHKVVRRWVRMFWKSYVGSARPGSLASSLDEGIVRVRLGRVKCLPGWVVPCDPYTMLVSVSWGGVGPIGALEV